MLEYKKYLIDHGFLCTVVYQFHNMTNAMVNIQLMREYNYAGCIKGRPFEITALNASN